MKTVIKIILGLLIGITITYIDIQIIDLIIEPPKDILGRPIFDGGFALFALFLSVILLLLNIIFGLLLAILKTKRSRLYLIIAYFIVLTGVCVLIIPI